MEVRFSLDTMWIGFLIVIYGLEYFFRSTSTFFQLNTVAEVVKITIEIVINIIIY